MKTRLLVTGLLVAGMAMNADAQVQANKQLQMTGTNDNDRRITGVGTAADSADAVSAATLLNGRLTYANSTAAGNNYAVQLRIAPQAYTAGMILSFKATWTNSGPITLNVNGLGAKVVFKNVNEALEAGDIVPNQIVSVIYDGTAFQIISQLKAASGFKGTLDGEVTGTQNATVISNGAVTTAKIADGAVTDAKLASGISYSKIVGAPAALPPTGAASGDLTGAYPAPAIASGAVTEAKMADGAVSSLKIQDGAIISLKLADGSVLTAKIADAAITSAKIADGAVTSGKIADGAVTSDKISSVAYNKITGAPTALAPTGAASGDLSGTYPAPAIAANAIGTTKLADGAVVGSKIADGAVTNDKITSLDYSKITGAPTAMAPSGTAGGDLSGSYPAPVIKDAAITGNKIAPSAITIDKINTTGAANGQVLTYDGSGAVWTTPATTLVGAASGDLGGSYPAPVIKDGVVTNNKIAAGAITDDKVAPGISYNKLVDVPTALPPSGAAGGDLSGTYPGPSIAAGAVTGAKVATGAIANNHIAAGAAIDYSKLNLVGSITTTDLADVSVSTAKIVDGAVTNEKITSIDYSKVTGAPSALPPSGAAGGDLDGTFPTPVIRTGVVSSDKLADGAVTGYKLAPAAVATAHVADGAITNEKITSVDYSKITGAPTSMAPTGVAGGDLDGTYPLPLIRDAAVTHTKLAAGAVTTDKINTTGAVSGQVLSYDGTGAVWAVPNTNPTGAAGGDLAGTYPNPLIADAAVTGTKLAPGAITNSHVAALANISYSKLNLANSIVGTDLTNNSVTTPKIANATVTAAKISGTGATSGQVLTYNGSTVTWSTVSSVPGGTASGDLAGSYPSPVVANSAITSAKIADGAITNADINASAAIAYSKLALTNSITGADITNSAISGAKIADGAVTTAKVADAAITDAKLASGISYSKLIGAPTSLPPSGSAGGDLTGEYPTPEIATGAVTGVKIANGAVETNKLLDGAVTGVKIADGAVTPAKINTVGATTGQVLTFNGTEAVWGAAGGSGGAAVQYHGFINTTASYSSGDKVLFPSVVTNVSSQMNTTTGVFTAAADGLYQVNVSLPSEASGARFLALRINGTDVFTGSTGNSFFATSPYNAEITALSLSVAYPLQAADQVEIVVYNNTGTATPLTNGSARLLITRLN